MKVLSFQYIVFNDASKTFALFLTHPGITVSRQVNEIPVVVNYKMIDRLGLPWPIGSFRQILPVGKHVQQRGFSDVRTTYESEFWFGGRRALLHIGNA
jgi:hypothetical protein